MLTRVFVICLIAILFQIVRFQDKESHQIFLEPEGRTVHELYVQVCLKFMFIITLPLLWQFLTATI